jgi:hypothetical protein
MDTPIRRTSRGLARLALATIASLGLAAGLTVAAAAPQPPATDSKPESKKPDSKKNVVTVRGCVRGSTLTQIEPGEYTVIIPETVRTTGSRAIRASLKEVENHVVEATGVLKGLKEQSNGALVKDTGKTKIYVGGATGGVGRGSAEDRMMEQDRLQVPTLDVSAVKDISTPCTAPE